MTKRYGQFFSALFSGALAVMLLWSAILPDRLRSETENRTLQQLPAITWDGVRSGKYMDAVEHYLADQFPLRDGWTGLKARLEALTGRREFRGVYLCGDTLISRVETPEAALTERNLAAVGALAEKAGIPVYLGLIPSAAEIWRQKLPRGATSWDQAAFLAAAAEQGVPAVDFLSVLLAHGDEPIFYRTDHHWTTLGAYWGYTAVLSALGMADETLPPEAFSPQTVSDSFRGTLDSSSGVRWLRPDTMEFWVPEQGLSVTSWRSGAPESAALYDRSCLENKDKYAAFLGGNQPLCVIRNPALAGGKKLLVIRDSYSDALAPFLSQSFAEVHLLDLRYYRASPAAYAAENGIDAAVVLYSVPNFITDRNLVLLGT